MLFRIANIDAATKLSLLTNKGPKATYGDTQLLPQILKVWRN